MATKTATTKYVPRLKLDYLNKFASELKDELKLDNVNQVPVLKKIVLNVGLGRAKDDKKIMEIASNTLRKITAQQPVPTTAKKSIAGFKLREGNKIGLKVTLRGDIMYEFLDRLITVVLPKLRDFHGLSLKSFDNQGNYSLGMTDQSVFPELSFEETTTPHGIQIVFNIKCMKTSDSQALLTKFGIPFEKGKDK